MEDSRIVELYWERNEEAISETKVKYENYLSKIAYNILADIEDSRESVNDTYLRAWYSMPPHKPQKRIGSEYAVSLDELYECTSDSSNPEKEIDAKILSNAINDWLMSISESMRIIFICRYFYCDSIRDIATFTGSGESKVKSTLHRARLNLREYLEKEDLL